MAAQKLKAKSSRRPATAHEKAVLKAAKARGLTTIDLRKPLSKYARSLVKQFEPVYRQEASVVKVPKNAKVAGLTVKRGRAIVQKRTIDEVARYDKKSGRIIVRDTKRGTSRKVGRKKNAKTRTVIKFKKGESKRPTRTYQGAGGASQAAKFLQEYDPEVVEDADIYEEYYDDDAAAWMRADTDMSWLKGYDDEGDE